MTFLAGAIVQDDGSGDTGGNGPPVLPPPPPPPGPVLPGGVSGGRAIGLGVK